MRKSGWAKFGWLAALATLMLTATACRAELGGDVKIDGEAFEPTSCRSGQANGFAGVDLTDNSGRTLRLAQSPTNQPQAILLSGNQIIDIGLCGTMTIQRQNSTVNDVTNVEGNATLECTSTDGHTVSGSVTFKNCH